MSPRSVLIYVDRAFSISIAANLVGITKTISKSATTRIAVNWLISAGADDGSITADQIDIREMLPEDLVYYFQDKIKNRFESLKDLIPQLSTGVSSSLIPGNVVSVCGKLFFKDLAMASNFSPFEPFDVDLKSSIFHGEECIVAELKTEDYRIPIYLPVSSKYQVAFCHNQPVEIMGIVRWTPPYSPGGSSSINLAIRCAVIWLK